MRKKISALTVMLALILTLLPSALAANELSVAPNAAKVYVDGKEVVFDAYNINGNNYFKLRDLAYALSGSTKQFAVTWDSAKGMVNIRSGQPYTPVGGELAAGVAGLRRAVPSSNPMNLDGKSVRLTAYSINGNNYVKLRDVGALLDFAVDWDGSVLIDTTRGYDYGPDAKAAAAAMLAVLDDSKNIEGEIFQAKLIDLNGDGLRELFVVDGMFEATLFYWADGTLHNLSRSMFPGGERWYLCRDAATGELGIECASSGGGDFNGGDNAYIYLSHQTPWISDRSYAIDDDYTIWSDWKYLIDWQEVSKAQYDAIMAQNIRLEELFGGYDNRVPNELEQTRAALEAMLAR